MHSQALLLLLRAQVIKVSERTGGNNGVEAVLLQGLAGSRQGSADATVGVDCQACLSLSSAHFRSLTNELIIHPSLSLRTCPLSVLASFFTHILFRVALHIPQLILINEFRVRHFASSLITMFALLCLVHCVFVHEGLINLHIVAFSA